MLSDSAVKRDMELRPAFLRPFSFFGGAASVCGFS